MVIKLAFQMFFYTLVVALILMVVPGIPPQVDIKPYSIRPPRKLEGKLSPNDILNKAELFISGKFHGPESVAVKGEEVYTGVEGGHILKVSKNGEFKTVATIGPHCDGTYHSPCARPLGIRFNKEGKLIVAEAFYGLFEVDVDAGTSKELRPNSLPLPDGTFVHYADDLDIDKDGIIYFSDASKVGIFGNDMQEVFGDGTGQLLKFDPKTKLTEILIDGLHYANGVQLSKNEDFLVVSETMRSKIWKYHLAGPKKGLKEVFVEGLPGLPDNIRPNGKGGFYISLIFPDTEKNPNMVRSIGPIPAIRKLCLRVVFGTLKVIELVDYLAPTYFFNAIHGYVARLGPVASTFERRTIIIDVDESGLIVGSLQNTDGKMAKISEIGVGEKYTYFGTPYEDKLWRIETRYLN